MIPPMLHSHYICLSSTILKRSCYICKEEDEEEEDDYDEEEEDEED
jgi:hypothetical protein